MTDFADEKSVTEDFAEIPVKEVETTLTGEILDNYSAALDIPREKAEAESKSMLEHQAKRKAQTAKDLQAQKTVASIIDEEPDPVKAQELLTNVRENYTFGHFVAPDIAGLAADSESLSPIQKNIIEKVTSAERLLNNKVQERSEGFVNSVGYFFDMALSSFVHSPKDLITDEYVELAREASGLFYTDLTKEEFETRFSEVLDRAADYGFFSEENPFYLMQFIELVKEQGEGNEARLQKAFEVADTMTMVFSGPVFKAPATSARAITALKSAESVAKATARKVEQGIDDVSIVANTATDFETVLKDDYLVSPGLKAAREAEVDNQALRIIRSGNWGEFVPTEQLAQIKDDIVADLKVKNKAWKRHEINFGVYSQEGFGNLIGYAVLGKRGGEPYKKLETAQKFADRIGGARVIQRTYEGEDRFFVVKEWNVPTEGLSDATDLKQVAGGLLSRIMSTTARTTPELDALIKRGEAQGMKSVIEIGSRYKKTRRKVSKTSFSNVNKIMKDMGEDPEFSYRQASMTEDEFIEEYSRRFGEPNEATVEYYKALRDLSDMEYFITADSILKEAVNRGEDMMELDGSWFRTRRVENLDEDDAVWFIDGTGAGRMVKYSDLDPKKAVVREVEGFAYQPEGGNSGVRYVAANSPKTRRLYHSDVLPYRGGGSRKYAREYDFYLKQESDKLKLLGGEEVEGKPKTFMAVRFEDEARLVVKQFNEIVRVINTPGVTTRQMDEVISANNSWNTDIEDIADLQAFADEFNLDLTKGIDYAPEGETLTQWAGSQTVGQGFWSAKARGDRPLIGFGGDTLDQLDPSKAIERDSVSAVGRKSMQNYLNAAVEGWLKAAVEHTDPTTGAKVNSITNWDEVKDLPPFLKFQRAVPTEGTKVGRKLTEEQRTIRYILSNTTAQVESERKFMKGMADYAFGKGWSNSAKAMAWTETGDPAGFLRAVAFHTKLGLFAVEQVYVQASQLINVLGVTSATIGPIGSARAMAATPFMRMMLLDSIPDKAASLIANTIGPIAGFKADDLLQLRDWLKSTGRDVVERTVVEKNNPHSPIGANKFQSFIEAGQVPFNEGEKIARIGAALANLAERRRIYPDEDIFSDAVTNAMVHRQDVLTASMTSASAAPWQRSLLAVPLQFTTYHVRMVEQLFTNKILTGKERASLASMHVFAYGAAGIPVAGYLQDRYGYEGAIDPTTGIYDAVRFGALDYFLSAATGEETALSARLAVGEGLFDLYRNIKDQGLFETAVGPGGSISWESAKAFNSLVKNVFAGKFDYTSYDWNRFARNVTSYDRAYTLWMAQRYGMTYSRNTLAPTNTDMSEVDTVLASLGIPLAERELLWTTVGNQMMDDRQLKKSVKEILRLDRMIKDYSEKEDWEAVTNIANDIGAILSVHTPGEVDTIMFRLRSQFDSLSFVRKKALENGKHVIADKLLELTE